MANLTNLKKRIAKIETAHGLGEPEPLVRWADAMIAGTAQDTPAARRRREGNPVYWEATAAALEWQADLIDLAADQTAPETERERARRTITEIGEATPPSELRTMAAELRQYAQRITPLNNY